MFLSHNENTTAGRYELDGLAIKDQLDERGRRLFVLWRRLSLNLYGMGSTARSVGLDNRRSYGRPPTSPSVQVFQGRTPDRRARENVSHPTTRDISIHQRVIAGKIHYRL